MQAGAGIDARDPHGRTPLHDATWTIGPTMFGGLEEVCLKEVGLLSRLLGAFGEEPADERGPAESVAPIIEVLVASGADINARNTPGDTPMHAAVSRNAHSLELIEALVGAGADIEVRDQIGNTPLHEAPAWNPDPAVVEALLAAEADPEARNISGERPLDAARGNEALRGSGVLRRLGDDDDGREESNPQSDGDPE